MREADAILNEALELPNAERAELALKLTASLDPEPEPGAGDAWAAEISRRIERLRNGTAQTVSADEALARARAGLRRD